MFDDWDPEEEDDEASEGGGSPSKKLSQKEFNTLKKARLELLKKCGDLNIQAYSDLILHIDDRTAVGRNAFNVVVSTKVQGVYPHGNARTAWKNLLKKYTPTTSFALSTLHKKFSSAKLKKGYDPDLYMVYLQDIRQKMTDMGHVYTDHQYMLQILSNLTDDYENVAYHLNHRLSNRDNPLTIDELRDELSARYELVKSKFPPSKHKEGGGGGEESALYAGAKSKESV